MKKTSGVVVAMMLLAACQTTDGTSDSSTPQATAPEQKPAQTETAAVATPLPVEGPKAAELYFIGMDSFDQELSTEMNKGTQEITVTVPGKFSVNEVPERLDRWFSLIKNSGGDVAMTPSPDAPKVATRGIIGWALELGEAAYDKFQKEALFEPASQYDVKLEFDPNNGKVGKMVFVPR